MYILVTHLITPVMDLKCKKHSLRNRTSLDTLLWPLSINITCKSVRRHSSFSAVLFLARNPVHYCLFYFVRLQMLTSGRSVYQGRIYCFVLWETQSLLTFIPGEAGSCVNGGVWAFYHQFAKQGSWQALHAVDTVTQLHVNWIMWWTPIEGGKKGMRQPFHSWPLCAMATE